MFGSPANSVTQEIYSGIQVSSSILGQPLPYVAGRQRVPFNLSWYGNFIVSTSNSGGGKGGGGNSNKQYSYSAAFIAALCLGPITGLFQIWHDKALETLTFENLALAYGGAKFVGSISGTTLIATNVQGYVTNGVVTGNGVAVGTTITGQTSGPAGGAGHYTVSISQTVASTAMFAAQPAWSGYPSGTPAGQIIPYDHLAYVASSAYNLGSSAGMPNLNFEVEGVVPGYSDANNILDADPSAVIPNYLIDPVIGALANYPGTPLIIGSTDAPLTGATNSYQAYCMAMGLLTSPYEYTQRQATDFMAELLQCTNSDVVLSYGTLKVFPYCDQAVFATVAGTVFSYTPNLTPVYILGDDDYVLEEGSTEPPVKLMITAQSDTYNEVNVEYLDRSNYYNAAPVNCNDEDDIAKFGSRLASTLSWHQITVATVARTAGQLWIQKQLREVNRYQFKTRRDYSLLEPGIDFVALNDSVLGLVNQVCQVESVEVGEDQSLTFVVIEIPGVTRSTAQFNWAAAQGYFANYATDPGVVQTPLIFQMPPIAAAISDGITLGIAVCGQTANAAWLGCDVYASVDGGTTYQRVGTMPEACRYGALTANFPAVADPDTSSTLSIALANTNLQISTSITHADADAIQTPILVYGSGGAEVMSFGTAALVSAGHYNLSYFRRGLYGSQPEAQTSGANFVRLDGAIFQLALDPGMAGQTISFKFVSFNSWNQYGPQTLASSTAYTYTIPAALQAQGDNTWTVQGPNAAVSPDGESVYKSGGSAAWDSAAYSPQPFLNGCFIAAAAAGSLTTDQMIGLSSNPSATANYSSLDLGLYLAAGGLQIYLSGTNPVAGGGSVGSYVLGDTFEVRYDGVTGRFFHNGALIYAVRAPGLKLYPKVCLESPTAVVSALSYGPASTVNQPTGSLINTYPWVIGSSGSQGNFQDIGGSGGNPQSQIVLAGQGAAPLGPYGTSEAIWESQGVINGADGGWNNNGDLYGIDSTKTYRSVVWVNWNGAGACVFYHGCDPTYTNNLNGTPNTNPYFTSGVSTSALAPGKWYLAVGIIHGSGYTGASSGLSGIYDPATGNIVSAGTDFVNIAAAPYQTQRVYQYYTSTATPIFYFAKPRFEEVNGNEPTLQALMAPASALQGFVTTGHAEVTGSTIAKLGGSSAWDSCVYSVDGYLICHVGGKANVGSFEAMIGFSENPSLSSSYINGNYCWYYNAGNWDIYESGTLVGGIAAAAATDLVEITYDGSTVTYLLNKISRRTVSISGLVLYAFVPLFTPGSGFNLVDFGPTTASGVIDTSGLGANAATAVLTASLSGTAGSFAVPDLMGDVTVGPYPYATSVILTVTGQWEFTYSGGTTQNIVLRYGISTATSTFSGALITVDQSTAALSSVNGLGPLSQEIEVSLAANTTTTYNVLAGINPTGIIGTAVSITGTIKAEVIKK